jgi:hypothetical protein
MKGTDINREIGKKEASRVFAQEVWCVDVVLLAIRKV